eukprot:symbB.v1.2.004084.t1/scaffold200.1/size464218/14
MFCSPRYWRLNQPRSFVELIAKWLKVEDVILIPRCASSRRVVRCLGLRSIEIAVPYVQTAKLFGCSWRQRRSITWW